MDFVKTLITDGVVIAIIGGIYSVCVAVINKKRYKETDVKISNFEKERIESQALLERQVTENTKNIEAMEDKREQAKKDHDEEHKQLHMAIDKVQSEVNTNVKELRAEMNLQFQNTNNNIQNTNNNLLEILKVLANKGGEEK